MNKNEPNKCEEFMENNKQDIQMESEKNNNKNKAN